MLGCPWRIDFSRAEALLIASSGRATSMSFFRLVGSSRRFRLNAIRLAIVHHDGFRSRQQLGEAVIDAGHPEIRLTPERLADVVDAVLVSS